MHYTVTAEGEGEVRNGAVPCYALHRQNHQRSTSEMANDTYLFVDVVIVLVPLFYD